MPACSPTFARWALCIAVLLLHGSALADPQEARAAYEHGDYRTALANFRPLAEKGDLEAQTMLGWMLVQGLGVSPSLQEGRKWLERAANTDGNAASAEAQHNLGVMYENGIGVPRNLKTAASWYLRGAQNGDASAQSNLGTLYLDGLGVDRDPSKGVHWLTKAAQQGDPEAYSNLGRVYFEGIGVSKNWPLSYYFLFMAVNHSGREVPNVRSNLEIVTRKLSATQLAEGKRLVQEALSKR